MERILIVEDSAEIAALVEMTLKLQGYRTDIANDGTKALELASKHDFDLILMDVMMPDISGFQVAERIKSDSLSKNTPIIFVTARGETDDLIRGLEVAVDYISKPFNVPELLARVRAALRMRKLQSQLQASNEQLSKLAVTDGLTGLLNRRGFDSQLEDEIWRARRFSQSLGLVIFDLDKFKHVNDTYGHAQGDLVLQLFAQTLLNCSRRVDKVARFGGEEFALLLPATDLRGVEVVCEKVRAATAEMKIPVNTPAGLTEFCVTTSGGGVVVDSFAEPGAGVQELATPMFEIADKALYEAKATGRNRIVLRACSDSALLATQCGAE